jgi:hypothetical protein
MLNPRLWPQQGGIQGAWRTARKHIMMAKKPNPDINIGSLISPYGPADKLKPVGAEGLADFKRSVGYALWIIFFADMATNK